MNKSKKLKVKKEKKDRLIEQKPITKISLPWLITAAALVVVLVVALLFDQLYKPTLMRIDGKGYNISDLAYYFYTVESRYSSYDSMFGGNGAYWDMTINEDTGETIRDAAKNEAVKSSLFYEVLYNQAVSEGYSLNDEEKKTIEENVSIFLNGTIPPADIRKNNFTKAYLTEILGKITLAERYRDDRIAELDIDIEEIKKDIDYEEYRQYDFETISISITKKTDDEGNVVDLTEEDKKAAYDKIKDIYEKAKTTEDWSTLIPDDETELVYKEKDYFTKSEEYRFTEEIREKIMAMENGEVSDIIEDENAYYIVRMINNNSSESYDLAVEEALTEAQNNAFSDKFDQEILPKHDYVIIDKALKHYRMGNITISNP
ncbi:MAG: hypothetical protein GX757_03980 [Clostridiales bacterium]|nr:hypothetical protein [Clostridiales bacterium]